MRTDEQGRPPKSRTGTLSTGDEQTIVFLKPAAPTLSDVSSGPKAKKGPAKRRPPSAIGQKETKNKKKKTAKGKAAPSRPAAGTPGQGVSPSPGAAKTKPRPSGIPEKEPDDAGASSRLAANLAQVLESSHKLVTTYMTDPRKNPFTQPIEPDPLKVGDAFAKLVNHLAAHPEKMIEAQAKLWQDYLGLWQNAAARALGKDVPPYIEPEKGDKRFRHEDWTRNQIFDFIKQSYLLTARWLTELADSAEGLDEKTHHKVRFYTKQIADAFSPSNFLMTNPEVLRTTLDSNGENLIRGLNNILADIERGKGKLSIRQTDMEFFEVGRNLATAPGKVVYQNDVFQLLQFEPTTETVYERPLLIFPPWINKYYILDLREDNSFIRWAVDRGYTVFVVSWVNPDARLAEKTFADYIHEGLFAALDAVEKATGCNKINTIGYCVGGTMLGTGLAYMAAKKDKRITSATFFAAQLDFEHAGDLKVFIDDEQLRSMEARMEAAGGYLEGGDMAATFNMLRANDLIWSFVVNNYLLGKEPFRFDLLYWNADTTRLPKALHLYYLRNFYHENRLSKGKLEIDGIPLDLGKVTIPIYLQSSKEDHIAPCPSVFKTRRLMGGPVRFIVAGSGHIAGVINPPSANKYQYWTNDQPADSLEEWWEGASEHPGSWWPDWDEWLSARSGRQVPARIPGDRELAVIEDAPGSYVKVRTDAPEE